jgi:hypothetical protein
MNDKGRQSRPTPCLITHYIVNDPGGAELDSPYVPLGAIESLEDPRLVRIANYEDGVSGRHDAAKLLEPFVQSLVDRHTRQRIAVVLHGTDSVNKVTQSLIEMVRGGIAQLPVDVTVFHPGERLDEEFVASLPFAVAQRSSDRALRDALAGAFDYVMLFESSGMYRGEDVAVLTSHLTIGRLDTVWGSRRLSVRDIQESIRFRYQKSPVFGAISALGSHVLSLACLALYGRYVTDTLSGVRAVRVEDALATAVPLDHPRVNQHLLAVVLRRKADLLEIPVHFLPISPDLVRRTSIGEGLQSLFALVVSRAQKVPERPAVMAQDARETRPLPHSGTPR